jgi:hypothetical protein
MPATGAQSATNWPNGQPRGPLPNVIGHESWRDRAIELPALPPIQTNQLNEPKLAGRPARQRPDGAATVPPRLAQRGSLFGSAVTAAPGRRARRDVPAPKRVPARPRPGRMRPNGSAAVRAQYPARCGSTSTRSPWDVVLRRRTIRRRGQLGDDHAVDIQHTDVNALATQIKTGVQHGEGDLLGQSSPVTGPSLPPGRPLFMAYRRPRPRPPRGAPRAHRPRRARRAPRSPRARSRPAAAPRPPRG